MYTFFYFLNSNKNYAFFEYNIILSFFAYLFILGRVKIPALIYNNVLLYNNI